MATAEPEEWLRIWEKIVRRSQYAPKAAADAMAEYIARYAREIKLRETSHPPGAYNRQQPGRPPAYGSGNLARSMYSKPSFSGVRASALTGNKAPYSRILEYGCTVFPVYKKRMSWSDSGGTWYHEMLDVPEHPFMRPSVEEAIDDGSLQEVAIEAFREYDP